MSIIETIGASLITIPLLILVSGYVLYPLILWTLLRLKRERKQDKKETIVTETDSSQASVSVIFTFVGATPETVLEKLKNAALSSPAFSKLEIIAIGDGPETTGTTEKVKEQLESGIQNQLLEKTNILVLSTEKRAGKTKAQNLAVRQASGEFLVFTDVNSVFDETTLPNIIAPLLKDTNSSVAVTSGQLKYSCQSTESTYWTNENKLKSLESRLHSAIGANGALYAMRKEDYIFLPGHAISDFIQPLLQLLYYNRKTLFVQNAKVVEQCPSGYQATYLRKRRITARALKSLPLIAPLLNPFARDRNHQRRLTAFSFFVFHKIIRWATAGLLLAGATGMIVLAGLQGLLTEAVFVTALLLFGIWMTVKLNSTVPVLKQLSYIAMTLLGQLWGYYATAFSVDTTTWEPLD